MIFVCPNVSPNCSLYHSSYPIYNNNFSMRHGKKFHLIEMSWSHSQKCRFEKRNLCLNREVDTVLKTSMLGTSVRGFRKYTEWKWKCCIFHSSGHIWNHYPTELGSVVNLSMSGEEFPEHGANGLFVFLSVLQSLHFFFEKCQFATQWICHHRTSSRCKRSNLLSFTEVWSRKVPSCFLLKMA